MPGEKPQNHELEGILEGLAESIASEDAANLVEEAIETGVDPQQIADSVKGVLLATFRKFEQRKLDEARRAYRTHSTNASTRTRSLPSTPAKRRRLLTAVFESKPRLGEVLTLQHRNLQDIPDEDVESALEELAELGFLDNFAQPSSEE